MPDRMLKCFVIACTFLLNALLSNSAFSETLTVLADNWCPYNCEPNTQQEGFGIEILREAFATKNINVEYRLVPWKQALDQVESNEYHAVVSANKTDSRRLLFPQTHFAQSTNCFFTQAASAWEFKGLASLKKIKLGAIESYSYGSLIDTYINTQSNDVYAAHGKAPLEKLMNTLAKGEVGAVIEDKNVFNYHVDAKNNAPSFKQGYCLPGANIYVAFAPNHENSREYIKIYDEQIQRFLMDGTYQKIMAKYQ